MSDASKRDDWIDALRAIALFGVFLINVVGYPDLLNHGAPAGAPKPLDSNAALTLHALTLGLVANKAYPLLCFLFGFSAQTMLGRANETSHLRARYWKLLLLGAAHGILLYAGDILALYATLGLITSKWMTKKPKEIIQWIKAFFTITIIELLALAVAAQGHITRSTASGEMAAQHRSFAEYTVANANEFITAYLGSIFILPMFLCLFLAGTVSARLRLLSHRRTARAYWAKHWGPEHLWIALPLNLAMGAYSAWLNASHPEKVAIDIPIMTISLGIYLSIAALGGIMRLRIRRAALNLPAPLWVSYLAPAGKHTMMMYLALSCGLLLSGAAVAGLEGTTLQRSLVAAAAWMLAILAGRMLALKHPRWKDPLSRWLGRTSTKTKRSRSTI